MRRINRKPAGLAERGAVAVEFALVLPLLMMFLFGIIQYGYGLFQYQAFQSAMDDASRLVATGVSSCSKLTGSVAQLVAGNGLPVDSDHPLNVQVRWLDLTGNVLPGPQRGEYVEVVGTYENPLNLNVPLVPFPDRFTSSQKAVVQDLIPNVADNLLACPNATAAP